MELCSLTKQPLRAVLALGGVGVLLLLGTPAAAQMALPTRQPTVAVVMPAGGEAGTTFELKVTGQALDQVQGLHFDFPGAAVEVLQSEKATSAAEMKKGAKPAPGAALTQHFKVTLPREAPLGRHDVRVVTTHGLSNPRAFLVSGHTEASEKEPNDDVPQAQRIALDTSVSGIIGTPTDVDYFVFTGKKGQRVVVSALSSTIDSKLPIDLQLYGDGQKSLGTSIAYHGNDALLAVTLPADGDYHVRLASFAYTAGGGDYFYHLTVTQAPWIDAVYPPTVEPGKEARVTIYGYNLPGGQRDSEAPSEGQPLEKTVVTIQAPAGPVATQRLAYSGLVLPPASFLDGFEHRLKNEHGVSNPALITFARAPVVLDHDANDTPETAQAITVPCEIAGRVEKKNDRDWYSFTAKKGDVYSIEAHAERLGAPLDLHLVLRDGRGNLITDLDDSPEVMSPQFFSRSDDPARYRFVVPADGMYQLLVESRYASTLAGPRHVYTVRIAPEEPDFRLVAMPPALTTPETAVLGQSGTFAYQLHVWRLDGFAGDIVVSGKDLPTGITVAPQLVPAGAKVAPLVVSAAADAPEWAGALHLVATAEVHGRKLVREVRSATMTWPVPQGIPPLSRLDHELVLAVRGKAPYRLSAGKERVSVAQGERVEIPVKLQPVEGAFKSNVQVDVLGLPPAVKLPPVTLQPGKDGNAVIDTKTGLPPGNYTLVLRGQTQPQTGMQPQKGAPPNLVEYTLPVALTVIPKGTAKLSVTPAEPRVRVGQPVELVVKLARQGEQALDFQVEVIFPPGTPGLSASPVTLKAGQDEARIVVTASPQAEVGTTPSVTVRATARSNGSVPVVHETKVPLKVRN